MRRAASIGALAALLGCTAAAPPGGECGPAGWVAEGDPRAFSLRATGVVTWDSTAPSAAPIVLSGTLVDATGDAVTTLELDTPGGPLHLELGVARTRLGVLPIGEPLEVTLGDGVTLANADGRVETALVSRRGLGDAVAANVTFRLSYAECLATAELGGCWRAMAEPLVDVVTGASVIRLPPGGVWRIPNDESPSAEIEIVRSVRAAEDGDTVDLPSPLCAELPAREIAAIIRHLR